MNYEKAIIRMLYDLLGTSEVITESTKLNNDLSMDSLDRVQVAIMCEKEFDISIDDSIWEKATCVADLTKEVSRCALIQ